MQNAIIEAEQGQFGRPLSHLEISQIDLDALDSFFEGLPPEYRTEIRLEGYQTLQEAYNKAVIVSKRLERDRLRIRDNRIPTSRFNVANQNPSGPSVTIRQPSGLANSSSAIQITIPATTSAFPNKICNYCKKMGHLISECRRRQYNNALREQGNASATPATDASRGRAVMHPTMPVAIPLPCSEQHPGTSQQQLLIRLRLLTKPHS